MKDLIKNNKAFTLLEMIIVIAIIAIIAFIAISSLKGYTEHAKVKVCDFNCAQMERLYEAYLVTEDIAHSNTIFNQILDNYSTNICPSGGVITYTDGHVFCSIHKKTMIGKKKRMIIVYLFYRIDWMNRAT